MGARSILISPPWRVDPQEIVDVFSSNLFEDAPCESVESFIVSPQSLLINLSSPPRIRVQDALLEDRVSTEIDGVPVFASVPRERAAIAVAYAPSLAADLRG